MATTTASDSRSEILDRQPPQSVDAERAVLGSILILPEVCDEVALHLRPEDFYDDAHQRLYRHMLAMHDAGRRVDLTLLIERLKNAGEFELIGGSAAIAEIAEAVPTAAHARYYAEVIRDKSMLRGLISVSTEILRDAYDESVEPREMIGRAEEKVFSVLDHHHKGELVEIRDAVQQSMDRIRARFGKAEGPTGLETGFIDFDRLCGGLHPAELIILAARPSMGKTALAMNIAEYIVLHLAAPTLFVSLEMSEIELADRMLSSAGKVNSHRMRNGTLTEEDCRMLNEAAAQISQSPLYIDVSPSRTMTEIAAAARRLKRKQKLGLIVIDYLQLIEPDNSRDHRQEQVAKIARRLKALARELGVPVLCLAQLNRQADDNKPRLSHLRESGAIEQDADVVLLIHREDYYQEGGEPVEQAAADAELIVAKQRNGPTGKVKLLWRKQFMRFENAAEGHHEEFDDWNPRT